MMCLFNDYFSNTKTNQIRSFPVTMFKILYYAYEHLKKVRNEKYFAFSVSNALLEPVHPIQQKLCTDSTNPNNNLIPILFPYFILNLKYPILYDLKAAF